MFDLWSTGCGAFALLPGLSVNDIGSVPFTLLARASRDPLDEAVALDRLRAVEDLRSWLDGQLYDGIVAARALGVSWSAIGDLYGISRQAAFQRWGREHERRGRARPPGER